MTSMEEAMRKAMKDKEEKEGADTENNIEENSSEEQEENYEGQGDTPEIIIGRKPTRGKRDAALCYLHVAKGMSFMDIARHYGLKQAANLSRRFNQLAEDPGVIKQLIAEEEARLREVGEDAIPPMEKVETPENTAHTETPEELTELNKEGNETTEDKEGNETTEDKEENEQSKQSPEVEIHATRNPNLGYTPKPLPMRMNAGVFGRHLVTAYNKSLIEPVRVAAILYKDLIAPATPDIREALYETMITLRERGLPIEWVNEAIITVSKKNLHKRGINYIIGLVRNWCVKGRGTFDAVEEMSVINHIKAELGYLFNKEIEHEVIRMLGLYGPAETIIKFHNSLKDFDISKQILAAVRRSVACITEEPK